MLLQPNVLLHTKDGERLLIFSTCNLPQGLIHTSIDPERMPLLKTNHMLQLSSFQKPITGSLSLMGNPEHLSLAQNQKSQLCAKAKEKHDSHFWETELGSMQTKHYPLRNPQQHNLESFHQGYKGNICKNQTFTSRYIQAICFDFKGLEEALMDWSSKTDLRHQKVMQCTRLISLNKKHLIALPLKRPVAFPAFSITMAVKVARDSNITKIFSLGMESIFPWKRIRDFVWVY